MSFTSMRTRLAGVLMALASHASPAAEAAAKDILQAPLRQWAAVLGMSLLGGFCGWYAKVRKGEIPGASLFALIGEMATSALAGLGAFFVCDYLGVPIGAAAAIAGLAGYMGGRVIEMSERLLTRQAQKRFGISGPMPLDDGRGKP